MNKKFLGITALAALILAGCTGNNPSPEPAPTPEPPAPEPTPTDPTIADLKARFEALGNSVLGDLVISGEVFGLSADDVLESKLYQNNKYSYVRDIGGVAAFQIDSVLGYYMVETTDTDPSSYAFEADWGKMYSTLEEFQSAELVSGFASELVDGVQGIVYRKAKNLFTITNEDLLSSLATRTGYTLTTGADPEWAEVSIADTSKIVVKAYASQLDSKPTATAELSASEETTFSQLESYLDSQTEFPAAPYSATQLLQQKFTDGKNFTRKVSYGSSVGYENTYVTENSKTVARDEGWTGQYAQYKYFYSLFNFDAQAGTDHETGIYRSFSYNSVDPAVIAGWTDAQFESAKGGYAPYYYAPADYQSMWVNDEFVNETLGASFGAYVPDAYTSFGKGFSVNPALKFPDGTTLIQYYSEMFGDLVEVADHTKGYTGYDVTSWNGFYFLPVDSEDETAESLSDVDSIYVVCEFTGSYWDGEESGEVSDQYEIAQYTSFGTTVDQIGAALITRESGKERAVKVVLDETTINVTAGTAFDLATIAHVVYSDDETAAEVGLTITPASEDADKFTIEGTSITVSAAGTYTISLSANGGTAVNLTVVVAPAE